MLSFEQKLTECAKNQEKTQFEETEYHLTHTQI